MKIAIEENSSIFPKSHFLSDLSLRSREKNSFPIYITTGFSKKWIVANTSQLPNARFFCVFLYLDRSHLSPALPPLSLGERLSLAVHQDLFIAALTTFWKNILAPLQWCHWHRARIFLQYTAMAPRWYQQIALALIICNWFSRIDIWTSKFTNKYPALHSFQSTI